MSSHVWALIAAAQDSVAYVAQKSGPPATETYMWAGYAITSARWSRTSRSWPAASPSRRTAEGAGA